MQQEEEERKKRIEKKKFVMQKVIHEVKQANIHKQNMA